MGGKDKETGGQTLRRCQMVPRRGYRPEMHGTLEMLLFTMFLRSQNMSQNITAFLMNQNQQFEDAMHGLNYARESLDPARYVARHLLEPTGKPTITISRLRNHDLLTSLDVLTTGSYRRLPTCIKVSAFSVLVATSY